MQDQELYEASTRANDIIAKVKDLFGLHLVRYRHLVDSSDMGFNCTYARITRREFSSPMEMTRTRNELQAIQQQVEWLLHFMEQQHVSEDPDTEQRSHSS